MRNAPYIPLAVHLLTRRTALHLLPVKQRVRHKISVTIYTVRLHRQPLYIREYTNDHLLYNSITTATTVSMGIYQRPPTKLDNHGLLTIPTTQTVSAARAIHAAAPHNMEHLPNTVKTATSLHKFSRLLKGHLFSHAFG